MNELLELKSPAGPEEVSVLKSKFIAYARPCDSDKDLKESLSQLRREHSKANHICHAARFRSHHGQQIIRFSDDGEPGGSAGRPILNPLVGGGFFQTAVYVVRYFGGTKLGVGGLVRAYTKAAQAVLTMTKTTPWEERCRVRLVVPYEAQAELMRVIESFHGLPLSEAYTDAVHLEVLIPAVAVSRLEALAQNRGFSVTLLREQEQSKRG